MRAAALLLVMGLLLMACVGVAVQRQVVEVKYLVCWDLSGDLLFRGHVHDVRIADRTVSAADMDSDEQLTFVNTSCVVAPPRKTRNE